MTGGCCVRHGVYYPAYPGCPECRQGRDMWPEAGKVLTAQGAEVRERMDQLNAATARAEKAERERNAAEAALRGLVAANRLGRGMPRSPEGAAMVLDKLREKEAVADAVIAAADKREAGS